MNVYVRTCYYTLWRNPVDTEQTPELWPPAGTTIGEDGTPVDPNGDPVEPEDGGEAEPPMTEDPAPAYNDDANEDLSGLPEGTDDGDTELEDDPADDSA